MREATACCESMAEYFYAYVRPPSKACRVIRAVESVALLQTVATRIFQLGFRVIE